MTAGVPPPAPDALDEVGSLIELLRDTEQRLDELTAREVDSVMSRDGRTFLLRRAQERLRTSESAKQAAILDALLASVALLDSYGVIIAVNRAWSESQSAIVLSDSQLGVGVNYLRICDDARGSGAADAHRAAAGIRLVLDGAEPAFSLAYTNHSPNEKRWFQMKVTALSDSQRGAMVMHTDVTTLRQADEVSHANDLRFRQMAENIEDVFFLFDTVTNRVLYLSPAFEVTWGRSVTEFYDDPEAWIEALHPDDRQTVPEKYAQGLAGGSFEFGYRVVRPDGSIRVIEQRTFPVRDTAGNMIRVAGVAEDVTERKRLEEALQESEQYFHFLDDLAQATRPLLDPEEVLKVVARMLGERLGVSRCAYSDVDSESKQFTILHDYTDGCPSTVGTYHLSMLGMRALETLSSGQTLIIRDVDAEFSPADGRDMFDAIGIKALISCPLVKEGRLRAIMSVQQTTPRDWSASEIAIVQEVVERCWTTIERRTAEEKLRERETMLRIAGSIAGLGGWTVRAADQRITWSDEMCQILEVPPGIVPSLEEAFSFYAPASRPIVAKAMEDCLQRGIAFDLEVEAITGKGRAIWVRCAAEAQRNQAGAIIQVRGAFQDITEHKRAAISITQLNRVYSVLSGINTLIMRVNNRDELFRESCRIAVETGGFRMAMIAIVDRATMNVVPVAWMGKDEELKAAVQNVLASGAGASHTMVARAIREKRAVLANDFVNDAAPVFRQKYADAGVRSVAVLPLMVGDAAIGVLALYADETEFFHQEEIALLTDLTNDIAFAIDHIEKGDRLSYLAYYDSLTGLANRVRIHDRLTEAVKHAQSQGRNLALILVDLERFKTINDTFGREAGDSLLREVAARMIVSASDVSGLARMDGDHFAVVSDLQTTSELGQRIEQRLVEVFGEPFRVGGSEMRIAAKCGVAMYPQDGADADALFRNAEAALKNAKLGGERYLFYSPSMGERVAEKLALEHKLRRAFDNEEFVLHYQPKVDLASGKVVSCEALIRWNDPHAGLVPPGKFIPILEETGLILEVGRWALRKAIADHLRWRGTGLRAMRIAVNVSPLQLRNHGFIAEIQKLIGVDVQAAGGLELEITEGMIMEDVKHTIATLQEIRALGVTVAIDDFGTGFSSLSYLARLPVDTLKIDRSFVNDMTSGQVGLALVSTIITLAHSVKLKVVAEGVETEEQSRLLQLLKCDQAQGFLFSKAVPVELFEAEFLAAPGAA